jgi:hypothetical protein
VDFSVRQRLKHVDCICAGAAQYLKMLHLYLPLDKYNVLQKSPVIKKRKIKITDQTLPAFAVVILINTPLFTALYTLCTAS